MNTNQNPVDLIYSAVQQLSRANAARLAILQLTEEPQGAHFATLSNLLRSDIEQTEELAMKTVTVNPGL